MIHLNDKTLPEVSHRISAPTYDRNTIRSGIVHIGVGGFHRSHQCAYMDDLFEDRWRSSGTEIHGSSLGTLSVWGIAGCGIRVADAAMHDALKSQDCLYTLVERDGHGDRGRVIGSLISYLYGPDDPNVILDTLASPETRIVTLTITEGGYLVDDTTGQFAASDEDVVHDVSFPKAPRTAMAYLTEALRRRRDRGISPFTILSCDNLPGNGLVAKTAVVSFAGLVDPGLARWIEANVEFPSSMVDRITPQTTEAHRTLVRDVYGIDDAWPVVCEPFRQWVIEDRFILGRPPWEDVGAQMVADVLPYETMKLRLLNASHSAMGYLGYLAGYRTIDTVVADADFRKYIQDLMDVEVTPVLPPVPSVDLRDYKATLIRRFGNPAISDTVLRICQDGSSKLPKFILPSIAQRLGRGESFSRLALCVAAWIRFLDGADEDGNAIPIDDPKADRLRRAAASPQSDPGPILSLRDIFGTLGDSRAFVHSVSDLLRLLRTRGARETLRRVNTPQWRG